MTLLRYLDLNELIKFIVYISSKIKSSGFEERFRNIGDITMSSIKLYYLDLLESIVINASELWPKIFNSLNLKKERTIINLIIRY
jgi:hypothetical protein